MRSFLTRLFESRGSDYYIYLSPDERTEAVRRFRLLLQDLQSYQRLTALIVRSVGIWVIVLFVLYLILAYRPDFVGGPDVAESDASVQVDPDQELNRQAVSSGTAFREYLARMAGTIPQECAIAEGDLKLPVMKVASNVEISDISLPGMAYMLQLFNIGLHDVVQQGNETFYLACKWRSSPASLLASISLDVGLVQKITLLFLIIGLLWLRRSRLQAEVDRAAFPVDDPRLQPDSLSRLYKQWLELLGRTGSQVDQADLDRAEHPITIIEREGRRRRFQRQPLYPVTYLGLDLDHDQHSQVRQYRTCVEDIRRSMEPSGQTEPFNLILDVLERGTSTGLAGEAGNRLRIAVFEYSDKLAGRLWPAEYILWLLPTIGFLGTIYGISVSLVRAKDLFSNQDDNPEKFVENIQLVVDGLGVAFDTTSLALICATVLYFSLCSVREKISQLAELARETLQNLLVRRMVDRGAIPTEGLPGDRTEDLAPVPHEDADNGAGEDQK